MDPGDASPKVSSWKAWSETVANCDKTWRSGLGEAEVAWLSLLEEAVFGKMYDPSLRLRVKSNGSNTPDTPPTQEALTQVEAKVNAKLAAEEAQNDEGEKGMQDGRRARHGHWRGCLHHAHL